MSATAISAGRSSENNTGKQHGGPYRDDLHQNKTGDGSETLANTLGWLSLGLGIAGIAAPGGVARCIGVSDDTHSRELLRLIGVREIISGMGILSQPRPAGWLWSRVAGDMMDLALLWQALQRPASSQDRVAATTAAIAMITAVDVLASQQASTARAEAQMPGQSASRRVRAITIYKPVEEVFGFWRNLENLPRFMPHLKSVREIDARRSRWSAEGPAGTSIEWEAEIVAERPNELIAWRSLPGSQVHHCGGVRFQQAVNRPGTEVRVEMEVRMPAGPAGELAAKLTGKDPGQEIANDLRTFKQILETGVDLRSDGTVGVGNRFPQRPAQPPSERELTSA